MRRVGQDGTSLVAMRRRLVLTGAVQGVVAAMCMTGLRAFTTRVGSLERTPPEAIVEDEVPRLVRTLSRDHAEVVMLLLHWGYGAVGGAVHGALPTTLRNRTWSGPAYGVALWALYDAVLAPALGVAVHRRRPVADRLSLIADHLLYGTVLTRLGDRSGS